jgi:hypothetical protein
VGCQLPNKYSNTTISAPFNCHIAFSLPLSCKFFLVGCQLPYIPTGSYEYIHHEEINVHLLTFLHLEAKTILAGKDLLAAGNIFLITTTLFL